jgi:hypothetical protein
MPKHKVGDQVLVKLSGGWIVEATIKAIIDTTDGVRLQVSFGEAALIYLWQIVKEARWLRIRRKAFTGTWVHLSPWQARTQAWQPQNGPKRLGWEHTTSIPGKMKTTMEQVKTKSVEPHTRFVLPEVNWDELNEPGAYVEHGSGDLYRVPKEAIIPGGSPMCAAQHWSQLLKNNKPAVLPAFSKLACPTQDQAMRAEQENPDAAS